MNKITKRIIIPVFAFLAALAVFLNFGGAELVAAYFTDRDATHNIYTTSENTSTVEEKFTPPPELHPGENVIEKVVNVKNTGNIPCYARVFLEFKDPEIAAKSVISGDGGKTWYSLDEYKKNLPEGWVYEDDAQFGPYFYYTKAINVNGQAENPLITNIKVTFAQDYEIRDFDVLVREDTVQTRDRLGQEPKGENKWKTIWTEYLKKS